LASRREPFGRSYSAKEAPKPRRDSNSYGCGIISDEGCFVEINKEGANKKDTMKYFGVPFLIFACFFSGCSAHYSSIKSDIKEANGPNPTAQIIMGSPQKIFSNLKDAIDENFIIYSHSLNVNAGKLVFKGKGTGALRGDVEVNIKLKKVTGSIDGGKTISGYSLDMISKGIGSNASMFPQYAVDNINTAFQKNLAEYDLSFVNVHNPKIERFDSPTPQTPGQKNASSQGTGFIVNLGRFSIVVTNYHVVNEAKDVEIAFSDGHVTTGKVIKRDQQNDLAIISLDNIRQKPIGFQIFPSHKVSPGQEVFVIGYPMEALLGGHPEISKGMISSIVGLNNDSRHFRITAQINPGNSGGPLLDAQGRVIGIVSHKLNQFYVAKATGQIPEGTNFAIKSALLLNLYPDLECAVDDKEIATISGERLFSVYSKAVVVVRSGKGTGNSASNDSGN
jgi:S1-C subfamily serine protease